MSIYCQNHKIIRFGQGILTLLLIASDYSGSRKSALKVTEQKASNFKTSLQKIERLPARKPASKGFPAFSRRGQNVFITCYKNIQGW